MSDQTRYTAATARLHHATGQFTREDPIGLAGGFNLHGFANGDPINFSDPFGLCPPENNNLDDCQTDTKRATKTSYCPTGTGAAAALGISRTTLHLRQRTLRISPRSVKKVAAESYACHTCHER